MSIPKLKKIKSEKKYHDLTLSDEYAWVDQPNILEVLKDANKLDPEVRDYISENKDKSVFYLRFTFNFRNRKIFKLLTKYSAKYIYSQGTMSHHKSVEMDFYKFLVRK